MPANERTLLLLLGHVNNEINVFQKLILAAIAGSSANRVVDYVETGQAQILLRTLIGKLHEARVLIDQRVTGDPALMDRYALKGQGDGAKDLRRFNRHFSRDGQLLAAIRNSVAFHSWDEHGLIESSFHSLGSDEPWHFYLAINHANSFYFASELVVAKSTFGHAAPNKYSEPKLDAAAVDQVLRATLRAAKLYTMFAIRMMAEILAKCFPAGVKGTEENIGEGPRLSKFYLPFFFDDDDMQAMGLRAMTEKP